MVRFALQFKATLENLTDVRPEGDDFRWFLKLKCTNCGEVPDKWRYVTLAEQRTAAPKGGRGGGARAGARAGAGAVLRCRLCARQSSLDVLEDSVRPYGAEDSDRFRTLVQFECRGGLEPVDFQPRAGFAARGPRSGNTFTDIDLLEKDWSGYDEEIRESVGIYEVTHRFIKS